MGSGAFCGLEQAERGEQARSGLARGWAGMAGLLRRKGGGPSGLDRLGAGFRPSRVWETGFVFLYTSLF